MSTTKPYQALGRWLRQKQKATKANAKFCANWMGSPSDPIMYIDGQKSIADGVIKRLRGE